MDATPPPPLLVSVASACASHAACAPLEHIARLVDAFVDPSPRLSPEYAVISGNVRLLQRMLHYYRLDTKADVFLQQLRLRRAMEQAATRGEMAMMELLHVHHPDFLAANALTLAAQRGDLQMIQWLATRRQEESIDSIEEALVGASAHGHLDVVRYLTESSNTPSKIYCPPNALQNAIENGHVEVAKYLTSRGVHANLRYVGDVAARNGHLSAVQYLHALDLDEVFTSAALPAAADGGHLQIVRFLHEHRTEGTCGSQAIDNAASGGFLDVVQFLHTNRKEGCKARAVIGASENGHLHILEWLHTHLPLTVKRAFNPATVAALASGQHEVLAWLESHFGPMPKPPPNAAIMVATAGNVAGLNKLHELQGLTMKWPSRVVEIAADQGNVEMIQWLHKHRPDMQEPDAMDLAAERGHFEAVKLLHEYGMSEGTSSTLVKAAASGNLAMVQWVDAQYAAESNFQEAMDEAAKHGHLEMVIWLHNNRSEGCTTNALDGAAASNHWEVVQWLVHNRSEGATEDGMGDAACNGHLKIASLLRDRYGLRMYEGSDLTTAGAGQLNALQWIYRVQPETVDLIQSRDEASGYSRFHVIDWIHDTLAANNE